MKILLPKVSSRVFLPVATLATTTIAGAVPISLKIENLDTLVSVLVQNTSHVTNAAGDGATGDAYTFSYTAAEGSTSSSTVFLSVNMADIVKEILASAPSLSSLTLEFDFISSTLTSTANQSFVVYGSSTQASWGSGMGTGNNDSWRIDASGAGWYARDNTVLLNAPAGSTSHFSFAIDLAEKSYSVTATNEEVTGKPTTASGLSLYRDSAIAPSPGNAGSFSWLNIFLNAGSATMDTERSMMLANVTLGYDNGIVIPEPTTATALCGGFAAIVAFLFAFVRGHSRPGWCIGKRIF
ncbi:MAG: hypothetical protein LBK99_25230 [Opitutaceae bacterium]|jgi:hypothetical protein|nr:hypothetical protein [Opitutaceae bacterium]